jgi:hypothetical protein
MPLEGEPFTGSDDRPSQLSRTPENRPNEDPPAGFEAVKALCASGKYKEALPKLQSYVTKGIANSQARLMLGHAYYNTKQYKKALAEFEWVRDNSALISARRDGESAAYSLSCYMKGVCPNTCLKASMPGWHTIPGKDTKHLWMTYRFKGGSESFSNDHIGDVIVWERGRPKNNGKCPICKGTGKVTPLK